MHENTQSFLLFDGLTRTRVNFGKASEAATASSIPQVPLISYHFREEQLAFPGGYELFAWKNGEQDSLARPSRLGCLNVPHGGRKTISALQWIKRHGRK